MGQEKPLRRVRILLVLFFIGLVLSGLTAFPIAWGIVIVNDWMGEGSTIGNAWPAMGDWITHVHDGVLEIDREQHFMFYGTDWLAFGHLAIAVFFLGAIKDPVRNVWVIEAGMIACIGVLPLAFICGPIRGIPFFWQLIDCSFGIVGIIPLLICRTYIKRIERG